MKLYIADDEMDVREGLKYLIDWEKLGFSFCGEGKNGEETLQDILRLQPDLVLLDIRMPRLSGLEVVKRAKEADFPGKFLILSGYSDFAYAQEAMRYGVDYYLTKPIDEAELEKAALEVKESLLQRQKEKNTFAQYREKAKNTILSDILLDNTNYSFLDLKDLSLEASAFQVILYSNYNQESFHAAWDFASILRLANKNQNSLEYIELDNRNIILLKTPFALKRFQELLKHYIAQPQKGSPLDTLFLSYGRCVYSVQDIHLSYEDALSLSKRRFFCQPEQHVLGYEVLPEQQERHSGFSRESSAYSQLFSDYIQTGNRTLLSEALHGLEQDLYYSTETVSAIKRYLEDLLIQVKAHLTHTYSSTQIPFPSNTAIIDTIEEQYYLYEIMHFFHLQFEMCMNALGAYSSESVMDSILSYIRHNYRENLRLESIAPLFGYNSSYLGKIFTKNVGQSFNSYVDQVRIEASKEMLRSNQYKVYEIAELVGYKNVDYFHKKFKKYVNMSPAEYRKSLFGSEPSA